MGNFKFAISMIKRTYKNCLFYVLSIACSIAALLNMFNITFNNDFGANLDSIYMFYSALTAIVLFITGIFIYLANLYFIFNNSKELAIIIISGRSSIDVGVILGYQNIILTIIGTLIGIILGTMLIPITNMVMYNAIGIEAKLFNIAPLTITMTSVLVILQLLMAVLIDVGYIYQREIVDLVSESARAYERDERMVKFNPIIYLVIYLATLIIPIIFPTSMSSKFIIASVMMLFGIVGIQGLIRNYIPRLILKLKETKYAFDKIQVIVLSNLHYSLRKATLLVITFLVSITLLIAAITFGHGDPLTEKAGIISFIVSIVLLAIIVIYKVLIETMNRKKIFKQLLLLGYNKSQIKNIIRNEVVGFFSLIILIPFLQVSVIFTLGVLANVIILSDVILITIGFLVIYLIAACITYYYYQKIVMEYIKEF